MTPFRSRNPVKVGAVSLVVLAALIVAALNAGSLPLIGGGDTYYAAFTEIGGLKKSNEVRVAGVRVGKVTGIELDGRQVLVKFKVETDEPLGTETRAAVKIKTLLGATFLALEPAGPGAMPEDGIIPVSRTTPPFDVVQAFSGLAETATEIDTDQLREALNAVAEATDGISDEFRGTLDGLSRVSENLAARDRQINTLLGNLEEVSGVLADRDQDIIKLMSNTDTLMNALVARRDAVHRLLVSTTELSKELTTLVRDSRADLKPALQNLRGVVKVLRKNQANIDDTARLYAPFVREFASVLGSGPWFDNWIVNFPPAPSIGGGGGPQLP